MSEEKIRVYALSGGPQDLSNLYLDTVELLTEMIKADLDDSTDAEVEQFQYTIDIKLMTRQEIDNLPEYEF